MSSSGSQAFKMSGSEADDLLAFLPAHSRNNGAHIMFHFSIILCRFNRVCTDLQRFERLIRTSTTISSYRKEVSGKYRSAGRRQPTTRSSAFTISQTESGLMEMKIKVRSQVVINAALQRSVLR